MRFPFDFRFDRRPRAFARGLVLAGCMLALSGQAPRATAETGSSPASAAPSTPGEPSAPIDEQALDLLVLRPLGAVRLVGGSLLWVPISLIQTFMDVNKMIFELPGPPPRPDEPELVTTFDVFVRGPARDVFTRPLGQSIDEI